MKFGAHIYLFTRRWADDQLHLLDKAKALGLDTLEIAVGDDVHFHIARTRRHAEELGMTLVASPGGEWPVHCDLAADDPAHRAAGLDWHRREVDRAARLGAVAYTGALYGHPGVVQRRRPPADEWPRMCEGLHHLAEHAAGAGVTLVLEPMSHFRTHLVNTAAQAMALLAAADHTNLQILLDTYHMITEEADYHLAIKTAQNRLWGLHACENNRGLPGRGLVPWGQVFTALGEIGFDGFVIMEAYNSSIGDFAYERGMFHDVCPDGEAFVREGLAFLKSAF